METSLENVVSLFEQQLKDGHNPRIEDYLHIIQSEYKTRLCARLVALEVKDRINRKKQTVDPNEYTQFGRGALESAAAEIEKSRATPFSRATPDAPISTIEKQTIPPSSQSTSQTIGPYKLLQQIGEGGMGTVWMAEQREPVRRRVALKLIKGPLADRQVIARFEAERQALAMMDHPNIARVLDAGTTATGTPYFVMELVNGIPINEYCDRNKLTPDSRLKLFVPVCKAIQHAHQKGIIHRDLKPSNVLVQMYDSEPIAKVIDFGLAKALQHQTKLTDKTMFTEFGQVVGTLQYMSPEQATMDSLSVDTRSDIYSLGVMLYELLAGSTPIQKETLNENALLQVLQYIREKEPPRPSHRLSTAGKQLATISELRQIQPSRLQQILRGELDWIVMKALEKDRTRRYETAGEFALDITNYLSGETVKARPPSTMYLMKKFAYKNRGLVSSMLAMLLILLAGIAGTTFGLVSANQKAAEAETQKQVAEAQSQIAIKRTKEAEIEREIAKRNESMALQAQKIAKLEKQRADSVAQQARESATTAKIQLAKAHWDANRVGQAQSLITQVPIEFRENFDWHYFRRHFFGSDFTCYGGSIVSSVAISPDGFFIASASSISGSDYGVIELWNANNGSKRNKFIGHTSTVNCVSFSPDGSKIASGSDDKTIKLWDVQTGSELSSFKHNVGVKSIAFSPDGANIVSGCSYGRIELWNISSGLNIKSLQGHKYYVIEWDKKVTRHGLVKCVSFSPDGKIIASAGTDGSIFMWNPSSGAEIARLENHLSEVTSVAFSPDGSKLASGSRDNTIKLWAVESGTEIACLTGHANEVNSVGFSPDGTRLGSGGKDKTIKLWDVASGTEIADLKGHANEVNSVAFSPDGGRIISGGKTIKVWDARTNSEITTLHGHDLEINSVSFSPDGQLLASGSRDHSIKVWDANTGINIATVNGHADRVNSVTFSPDGKLIASASSDESIMLWDAKTGTNIATLNGHTDRVNSVTFSPDGKLIASASSDESIMLWDVLSLTEIAKLEGHNSEVNCVSFCPGGESLASASRDNLVKLWDIDNGVETGTLKGHTREVNSVTFSPDGERIASGSLDRTIRLWDANTGSEITTLQGHTGGVFCVTFSPNGARLASGSYDAKINVWDARSGLKIATLKGHEASVNSVLFNPSSTALVSGSTDRTIKIWGGGIGSEITILTGHTSPVRSVTFNKEGSRVASGSRNGWIKVWNAHNGVEIKTLKGHQSPVSFVGFCPDGFLYSKEDSHSATWVWDLESGEATRSVVDSSKIPSEVKLVSSNGRWQLTTEGNNVLLVDLEFKTNLNEKAYRNQKARFKPLWHLEMAMDAQNDQNWYAATFHYSLLLVNYPQSEDYQQELKHAFSNLEQVFINSGRNLNDFLSPVVIEALELCQ